MATHRWSPKYIYSIQSNEYEQMDGEMFFSTFKEAKLEWKCVMDGTMSRITLSHTMAPKMLCAALANRTGFAEAQMTIAERAGGKDLYKVRRVLRP